MVILKKIVIMTEYGKSNCSGIVKFENFAGRTSCFVRILGLSGKGVICIKCGEDIMYCGTLIDGEHNFNALYDLNKTLQIVVVADGGVVCMGSNRGRFSPNVIMTDIHRYYAGIAQVTDNVVSAQETAVSAEVSVSSEDKPEPPQEQDLAVEQVEVVDVEPKGQQAEDAIQTQEEVIAPKKSPKQNKKVVNTKTAEPFYKKIEKNLQQLFDMHEKDEELTLLIPNSKWARVPIEGDGYYVVGVIENDGIPDIICYGVPDKDDTNPPQNSSDCRQWMEIEKGGRGYWMMYQSAVSGATLTTSII